MQEKLLEFLNTLVSKMGLTGIAATYTKLGVLLVVLFVLCFIANLIAKRILLRAMAKIVSKTKTKWDDILQEKKVFSTLSHLAPAVVIYATAPVVFHEFSEKTIKYVQQLTNVYVAWITVIVVINLLDAVQHIVEDSPAFKAKPLDSFFQLLKMIAYLMGFIAILSILMEKSPVYFFTALGTMTAVLMLVFKDAILGLVASIQIAANDMLRLGDWVEMPRHGLDGNVTEINLTTIKVQNFDKTISNIPSYAFISESFKNWRGMSESGGRRIKRAFQVKAGSVRFCDSKLLENLKKYSILKDSLEKKQKEFESYNKSHKIDQTASPNGKHLTNLTVFRLYLEEYLKAHEDIHKEMTYMVRELAPTSKGVPVEVYAFSNKQQWILYEKIAADIFDHIFATLPFFELEVFEDPTGTDIQQVLPQT